MRVPAWKILCAAIVVGIAGDSLLRGGEWRAGFAFWILGIIACHDIIGAHASTERRMMLIGLAMAAFGLVWRDAPMLYAIDFLSVLTMGALIIWHGTGRDISHLNVVEAVRAGLLAPLNSLGGAGGVLQRASAEHGGAVVRTRHVKPLVIGTVLAVPPLVVVASLLASSDPVFNRTLERMVSALSVNSIGHVVIVLLLAWPAAGWLRAALGDSIDLPLAEVRSPRLTFASVAVGLYSLIVLLTLFLGTQARVLFGGAAFLRETQGLSVANYARSGFFQLIVASVIVLGTLVIAEWLMGPDDDAALHKYRRAGTLLIGLVAMLLVSAVTRIWLYVDVFGLSVDRGFATAAIVLVFAALTAFSATTLRGRSAAFGPTILVVLVAWVTALNVVNPEALVVRVNVARAARGWAFDSQYHSRLSADALPALLRAESMLPAAPCAELDALLRSRWRGLLGSDQAARRDWRSRNLPRARAAKWLTTTTATCGAQPHVSASDGPGADDGSRPKNRM
jgi:Domain of unknown function (DUF4173)